MPMWPSYRADRARAADARHAADDLQEHNFARRSAAGSDAAARRDSGRSRCICLRARRSGPRLSGDGADRSWTFAETTCRAGSFAHRPTGAGTQAGDRANVRRQRQHGRKRPGASVAGGAVAGRVAGRAVFSSHQLPETRMRVGDDEIVVRSRLHLWLLMAAVGLLLVESFLNWFTGRYAHMRGTRANLVGTISRPRAGRDRAKVRSGGSIITGRGRPGQRC